MTHDIFHTFSRRTPALFMTRDVFDTLSHTLRHCLWLMTYLIHFPTHSGIVYESWPIWYIFTHTADIVYDPWRICYYSPHTLALFMTHNVFDTFSHTLWHCHDSWRRWYYSPHTPALFMASLTQTAGNRMAAPCTVVFTGINTTFKRRFLTNFVKNKIKLQCEKTVVSSRSLFLNFFFIPFLSMGHVLLFRFSFPLTPIT